MDLFRAVIGGIVIIGVLTLLYIPLQQVWEATIEPHTIEENADPANMQWISVVWNMWPIFVGIAFIISVLLAGKKSGKGGYTE